MQAIDKSLYYKKYKARVHLKLFASSHAMTIVCTANNGQLITKYWFYKVVLQSDFPVKKK